MADDNPLDPDRDPFHPPTIPTLVGCLHCGEEYDSYKIEWRVSTDGDGKRHGFWCCPTPGCGGCGFGFDIFPVDPDYVNENGERMWVSDDDDDEDDDELEDVDDLELPDADPSKPEGPKRQFDDDEDIPF